MRRRTTIQTTDGRVVPFEWEDLGKRDNEYLTWFSIDGEPFTSAFMPLDGSQAEHLAQGRTAADFRLIESKGYDPQTIDFFRLVEVTSTGPSGWRTALGFSPPGGNF